MLNKETLQAFGADVTSGLARCVNNEALYFRLVRMSLEDPSFDKLRQAAEAGDVPAAFSAAHSLKGSLSNLSLTPLAQPAIALTELLRAGNAPDEALMEQLFMQRDRLKALCEA